MNLSTSDDSEKTWDHPWTTAEMRQYQNDWSLAGDVGLLRHLQQFSENLTATVKNTQTTLDVLNSQLNETTVLIDNVTNASLALANTQFIESRVYEDDVDQEQQQDSHSTETDKEESLNNEAISEAEMIAAVSQNIQQGLAIMNEKYERVEVLSSDSEDENEQSQQSFILRPKDPYQHRALPYVIGTEKWRASSKIGLESSSSESEVIDEDDDDEGTENDKDMDELSRHIFIENSRRISILRRSSSSSSSSSGSSDFNETSITNKQYSGTSSQTDNKLYTRSQDTLNSASEITTPTVGLSKGSGNLSRDTPSFAEELAKRLGNVMPSNKSIIGKRDVSQSSINRHVEDDLFASNSDRNDNMVDEDNGGDIFSAKSDNLFSDGGGLFDDDGEVSNSLWKDKPIKRPSTNIIPPSIDVPPPMHSTETKHKSAIDDLFGDGDSDDSDDIFAPKIAIKPSTIKPLGTVNVAESIVATTDDAKKKMMATLTKSNINNITTSTPETNNNIPNLFEDDENDENLFGSSQKPSHGKKPSETSRTPNKGRPPGILVSQSDLLASNLGNRLFNRIRQESSDSSGNEDEDHPPDVTERDDNATSTNENSSNISTSVMEAGNRVRPETSDSSGISVHPQSMNSTLSFGGTNNWTPQMESTRLLSEELYRDRLTSDSLLNPKTRQQNSNNSNVTVNSGNPSSINRIRESSDIYEESLFENDDDVFSPPPLPKNKSKSESKVTSLFDDSDSGDDLFSNTSSGSRSQKSADILTNLTQQHLVEKSKSGQKRSGLFDEDVDIFTNRNASPDVDIFSSGSTSKNEDQSSNKLQLPIDRSKVPVVNPGDLSKEVLSSLSESTSVKPTSIFDDSDPEDEDLFNSIIRNETVVNKFNDENNFVAASSVSLADQNKVLNAPKKDFTAEVGDEVGDRESKVKSEKFKPSHDQTLATNTVPNSCITNSPATAAVRNKLFDDSDEDDDDNLFRERKSVKPEIKSRGNQSLIGKKYSEEGPKSVIESVEHRKISMEPSDKSNELSITQPKNEGKDECSSITDESKTPDLHSNVNDSPHAVHTKREPPKSLKICLPVANIDDDPDIPPRRAVSGKIKDLMGKMGDLKILSPTDTPLLWRKSGEIPNSGNDDDKNITQSCDSEDGSSVSLPKTKIQSDPTTEQFPKKESPRSPSIEIETAVSFDTPAQPDTLVVTAKSRARIPVKRRPQSRHARQSALRASGVDFDTVDSVVTDSLSDVIDPNEISRSDPTTVRSVTSIDDNEGEDGGPPIKSVRPILHLISDDKSEISLEKESSISITKNTLLSPSTDEEDLFDVPPDLPEDPQKEDGLFGRAPILSPIQKRRREYPSNRSSDELVNSEKRPELFLNEPVNDKQFDISKQWIENEKVEDHADKPNDPLRDSSHDPLKDPSQLFAFVTKTPSPEKDHNLTFNEDVSLFAPPIKNVNDDMEKPKKSFDIFANDSTSDLFSGSFTKTTTKKPTKGIKSNLFNDLDSDDEDGTEDLFGSASSKRSNQSKSEHSDIDTNEESITSCNSPKRTDAFDDDDDEDLFFDASEKLSSETGKDEHPFAVSSKIAKPKLEDIFGDSSNDNDDIFTIKKPFGRGRIGSGPFFAEDAEDKTSDIFAKKHSSSSSVVETHVGHRAPIKKAITRDLRSTAEKIVEDPLSMLRDD